MITGADSKQVDAYELLFKGFLPGDRAMKFQTAHSRVSLDFVAPTSIIMVLASRRLILTHSESCLFEFLTVTMPRWKARYERLDPERDALPDTTADDLIRIWLDKGDHHLTSEIINKPAAEWKHWRANQRAAK
jgi:hypothetical protein